MNLPCHIEWLGHTVTQQWHIWVSLGWVVAPVTPWCVLVYSNPARYIPNYAKQSSCLIYIQPDFEFRQEEASINLALQLPSFIQLKRRRKNKGGEAFSTLDPSPKSSLKTLIRASSFTALLAPLEIRPHAPFRARNFEFRDLDGKTFIKREVRFETGRGGISAPRM